MGTKQDRIAAAQAKVDNAAATTRALAEAFTALSILTNSGDTELDVIARRLRAKLDEALIARAAASAEWKAAKR